MANIDDIPTKEQPVTTAITFPVKLGIIGSTDYDDYNKFDKRVRKVLTENQLDPSEIICGDTERSPDLMAEQYAITNDINYIQLKPDKTLRSDEKYLLLHRTIARRCTHLIIFRSMGDEYMPKIVDYCKTLKKRVFVFIDDKLESFGVDFYADDPEVGLRIVRRPNETPDEFRSRADQEYQQWQRRRGQ